MKSALKSIRSSLVCLSLIILALHFQSKTAYSEELKTDQKSLAAVVNGHEIYVSDIDRVIKQKPQYAAYAKMSSGNDANAVQKVRAKVLDNMIDRQLLIDASLKSKSVDEKDIAEASKAVVAKYGGEERLVKMLAAYGSSIEEFKRDLHDDLLVSRYLDNGVLKTVKVDQADLRKAFDANPEHFSQSESISARHILIKADKNASPEADKAAKDKINEIYSEVVKPGADFASIAKEKSECPSAAKGGDLGYFSTGAMVPEFEKAAFALKTGEISKPVRSEFGYHIIKLEDRKAAGKPDFEKAKPLLERELLNRKKMQEVEVLVKNLRNNAKIDMKFPKIN